MKSIVNIADLQYLDLAQMSRQMGTEMPEGFGGRMGPIGKVVGIHSSPAELTETATIDPYVDFSSLDVVAVVTQAPRVPLQRSHTVTSASAATSDQTVSDQTKPTKHNQQTKQSQQHRRAKRQGANR